MNAMINFPTQIIAEIRQVKRDVTAHQREIELSLEQYLPDHQAWRSRDREIENRLDAIRRRLVALYA